MTRDTTMSDGAPPDPALDDLQQAALRAADAIASADDVALLQAQGMTPESLHQEHQKLVALLQAEHEAPDLVASVLADLNLSVVDVREVLLAGAGRPPELSQAVLQSVSLSFVCSSDALLAGALGGVDLVEPVMQDNGLDFVDSSEVLLDDAGGAPELSDGVTGRLGLATVDSQEVLLAGVSDAPDLSDGVVGAADRPVMRLRDLLLDAAGEAPDLAAGVLDRLGLENAFGELGRAVRAEAGPAPELSGSVLSRIGVASNALERRPEPVVSSPSNVVALRRRWALLAVPVVAMAAAILLFVSQALVTVAPTDELIAFSTDVANRIEIEDISTDVSAVVHVIPGDFDDLAAPTIIFIDELDEEDDAETDRKAKGKKL